MVRDWGGGLKGTFSNNKKSQTNLFNFAFPTLLIIALSLSLKPHHFLTKYFSTCIQWGLGNPIHFKDDNISCIHICFEHLESRKYSLAKVTS